MSSVDISFKNIHVSDSDHWHYDIPDGYFDNIGELIDQYKEHDIVRETFNILSTGDLEEHSAKTMKQISELEQQSLKEYLDEDRTKAVLKLRQDMNDCSQVLQQMATIAGPFEEELGGLSKQIQSLLDESKVIQNTLEERRPVEVELEFITSNIVIDDELIAGIYRAPMNETFIHYAKLLSKKKAFINSLRVRSETLLADDQGSKGVLKALEDVEPELSKLIDKMVGRVRHYLLHKVYSLHKPSSNLQILQTNLTKHRLLYTILLDFNLDIATEFKTQYVHTIVNIYATNFKSYFALLSKLRVTEPTKTDTLGQLDTGQKTTKTATSSSVFALGDRGKYIVEAEHAGCIIPHVAAAEKKLFYFERVFYSLHRVLMDTISGEVAFQREFFRSSEVCEELIGLIFNPIISWYEEYMDEYLGDSYDAIAIILMIRELEMEQQVMASRGLTELDQYFAMLNLKLFNRFELIMNNHLDSLINLDITKLDNIDTRPHYMTRRYAEFSTSLNFVYCRIEHDAGKKKIMPLMKSVYKNVKQLLHGLVSKLGQGLNKKAFLVNNYELIVSVLSSKSLQKSFDYIEFRMEYDGEVNQIADEELISNFGFLLSFIKRKPTEPLDEKQVTKFVSAFQNNWKQILAQINNNLTPSFPNYRTVSFIMQRISQQTFEYYKLFEEYLKKHHNDFFKKIQVQLVPHTNIIDEIKGYGNELV